MSDRLRELYRQRELLREHAAWLEREIAAAEGKPAVQPPESGTMPPLPVLPPLPSVSPAPRPAPPPSLAAGSRTVAPEGVDADAMIRRYGSDPTTSALSVKRGCWTTFGAALLLLFACVLAWYLLRLAATAE